MVSLQNLTFAWDANVPVLNIPAFQMEPGERVFLHGASGSGKSTFLGILGGVLRPTSGEVCVLGEPLGGMRAHKADRFRADHLGIIFQMFNLLPYLSILENVLLPCRFSTLRAAHARESRDLADEADRLLSALGLPRDITHRPVTALSVGQQQRVAAARALIGRPALIIADEPTSALDTDLRSDFVHLLLQECELNETGVLFVSHDKSLSPLFDRTVELESINHIVRREVS